MPSCTPPVDRDRAIHERADVCVHAVKETDSGIYVSGAKIVATGSALTHATFVAHHGLIPVQDKRYACVFMVPMNAPGVKLISRASYENTAAVMGTPFDYPLSSRLDENDAIFVLENTFIPWEDIFSTATSTPPTTSSRKLDSSRAPCFMAAPASPSNSSSSRG